ncbi:hypothetical protein SAMN05518856_1252 [Paenibacillus sp. OK003]|nr:hypothetical protein SAMN05518856_1252 [Paenibacillus sp. OK003]
MVYGVLALEAAINRGWIDFQKRVNECLKRVLK